LPLPFILSSLHNCLVSFLPPPALPQIVERRIWVFLLSSRSHFSILPPSTHPLLSKLSATLGWKLSYCHDGLGWKIQYCHDGLN
jgi:hypothetical protein